MIFDFSKVRTTVNADKNDIYNYGYFANTLSVLKETVEREHSMMRSIYAMLTDIASEDFERRFMTETGNFALFYKMCGTEEELD